MARRIIYYPPAAAALDDARIDDVVELLRNGGADYWREGAASLEFGDTKESPTFLMMLTKYGFYVEAAHVEKVNDRWKWFTYIPDAELGRTEVDEP